MPTADPGPAADVTVPDGCPDPHTVLADDRDTFAAVATAAQTAADHPDNHTATVVDRYIADLTDAWTRTRYPTLVNIAVGLSRRSPHSSRDDALHAVHASVLDLISDIRRDRRTITNIPALLTTKARWKLRVLTEADTCGFTGTSGIQRRRHRINRARADYTENTGHDPDPDDLIAHTNRLFPPRGHDSPVTAADLTPPPATVTLNHTPHDNNNSGGGEGGEPRPRTGVADPGFDHDSCEHVDADRMWQQACEAALHLDPTAGRLMHNAWILYRTDEMLPTRTEIGYLLDLPPAPAAVHRAIMVEILRRIAGTIYNRNPEPPWQRVTRADGATIYTPTDRHPYADAEAAAWITAWLRRANNQHTIIDRVPKHRHAIVHPCDHPTCVTAAAADMPDRTPIHPHGETIDTSQLTITQPDLDFDQLLHNDHDNGDSHETLGEGE